MATTADISRGIFVNVEEKLYIVVDFVETTMIRASAQRYGLN